VDELRELGARYNLAVDQDLNYLTVLGLIG